MPKGPEVGGGIGAVVGDPDYFFVGWDSKGYPRAMDVVLPEQVVSDDPAVGMDDRNCSAEREPLVSLEV